MKRYFYCFCFLLISISAFSQTFSPVNRAASPAAKQLLSYLYSINGKQLLSGQHDFNEGMNRFDDSVYAITGKYPAVWAPILYGTGRPITDRPS